MPDIYNNEGHRNTGRTIYGHMREGNTRHGGTGLTLLPPPKRHIPHRATSNGEGGGCSGGTDTETGQEASRAAPVPGPTVEQGAWLIWGIGRPWLFYLFYPSFHLSILSETIEDVIITHS